MKSKCDLPTHTFTYSSSCCITQLILMYNKTENNNLFNTYGILLLKTLNTHFKSNPSLLLSKDITLDQLCIFCEILSHYSAIYYYRNKFEYSKLFIKFGIDSINQSKYKTEPKIIERKNALVNNMACIYKEEDNYDKASQFFDKLIQTNYNDANTMNSSNSIDRAIAYNNLGLIEIQRSRIAEGVGYLNLAYEEIKGKLVNQTKSNKVEVIALMLFNYCYAYKRYLNKSLDAIFAKGLEYSMKHLSKDHPITINFLERKLEDIESICSSDSSPEVLQESQKNLFSKYANFPIISNPNVNSKDDNMHKESKDIPVESNAPNETSSGIKENSSSIIAPDIQQPSNPIENLANLSMKKKETKTLPFKKKKLTLKECFSAAYNSIKPQTEAQTLFTSIAKNIKAQKEQEQQKAALLSKLEEAKDNINNQSTNNNNHNNTISIMTLNKYNEIMSSFESSPIKESLTPSSDTKFNMDLNNNKDILIDGKVTPNFKANTSLTQSEEKEIKTSTKSFFSTSSKKKGTTELFKHLVSINEGEISHPFVEATTNFELVDYLNNLYVMKNEDDLEKEVARIINKSISNPLIREAKYIMMQSKESSQRVITIISDDNSKTITLSITELQSNKEIYKESIAYDAIINILNKICVYSSMPQHCNLSFIPNVASLINKIIIKHYQLSSNNTNNNNDSNKLELSLMKYQMSISRKSFALKVLNINCSCTFFADNTDLELVLYSQSNPLLSLRIDIYLDESSFNIILIEKEENGQKALYYKDNFNYEAFFTSFLFKMQEIIKLNICSNNHSKHSNTNVNINNLQLDFETIMSVYSKSVLKFDIQNSLRQKDFWIISKDPNEFQWRINLYTLEKIVISNGAFYINKQITLDSEDFINIIGSDPRDVYELMSDREILTAHKILLNTVKMRNIVLKILTEKNYDSMLKLIKIKPSCFFRFTFTIIQNKKYFCCAFEFIIYSKENYFLRLMLTETITSRSYSKLYLPYYMNKTVYTIDELKKILVEEFKLKKELFNDKKRLRNVLVDEAWGILTKKSNVVFYENIDIILSKFINKPS